MSEVTEELIRAATKACKLHGVPAMSAPFVPSKACWVAMTAIMNERNKGASAERDFQSRDESAILSGTPFQTPDTKA